MLKVCGGCKRTLALSAFYCRADTGRHVSQCKECRRARIRQAELRRKARDPERFRRQAATRVRNCRARRSPEERHHRDRFWNLKLKYGLTPEQYDAMFAAQGGVCAICKGLPDGRWKRLHVDHNHETGEVRALLCGLCNVSLGGFRSEPDLLRAAIAYLERYGAA